MISDIRHCEPPAFAGAGSGKKSRNGCGVVISGLLRRLCLLAMTMVFVIPAQAADLTGITCEQSEAVVLRFGGDRAEKKRGEATFRIDMNKLYAKDDNGQENEFPLDLVKSSRYVAGNRTIIFNPDFTGADVAYVTMTDVQMSRWRCEEQKK